MLLLSGSRKFCQRGPNLDNIFYLFFIDDGRQIKRAIIEYWVGSFLIFQGILTSNAKKHYIFLIFQGVGVQTPCPPLDPRMLLTIKITLFYYSAILWEVIYSKPCVKRLLLKRQIFFIQNRLSLNAGQKYCRMLQRKHSTILSTCIRLPFVTKIFVMSLFEWPFYTGSTVSSLCDFKAVPNC